MKGWDPLELFPIWITADNLDLRAGQAEICDRYIFHLFLVGITFNEKKQTRFSGMTTLQMVIFLLRKFSIIFPHLVGAMRTNACFQKHGNDIYHKILLFRLFVQRIRILTWGNLCKWGFQGPGRCFLCQEMEESALQLFIDCPVSKEPGYMSYRCYAGDTRESQTYNSIETCFRFWFNGHKENRTIPFHFCWGLG